MMEERMLMLGRVSTLHGIDIDVLWEIRQRRCIDPTCLMMLSLRKRRMSENVHRLLMMSIDVVASSGTTASLFITALSVLEFGLHCRVVCSVSAQE